MSAKTDHTRLTPDQLPEQGFSRAAEVLKYVPFKKSTLWAWSSNGRFPAAKKIGSITCWKNSDVLAWLAQQGYTASNDAEV